ncbi:DUF4347 domain-containing protein, partial [Giesbergeria sinuosa]
MTALISPIFDRPTIRQNIVFIEDNLTDWQKLVPSLASEAHVVVLDSQKDGLQQMAEYLAGLPQGSVDAIHLLSHGSAGQVQLGYTTLGTHNLQGYAAELAMIGRALSAEGDWLLYGCDVGAAEAGASLLAQLHRMTQADIAASTNLTGHAAQGGDWVLETRVGEVSAAGLVLPDYMNALAVTVSNNFATGLNSPVDLTTDSQNNLYVVSYDNNQIYKINSVGGAISGGAAGAGFFSVSVVNIVSVAIDSLGNLYAGTGNRNHSVIKYPASGGVPGNSDGVDVATGFNLIADLLVASDGYLYIADSGDGKVYKMPNVGGPFTPVNALEFAVVPGAQQIYIDANNNLYATSADSKKVIKFSASNGQVSLSSPSDFITGLSYPQNITSDGVHFYVGDEGTLYKFGLSGGVAAPANIEHTFSGASITEVMWAGAGSNTLYVTLDNSTISKIALSAFNTAPTITSDAVGAVDENADISTVVYTATAFDAESNAITYSLSGTDASLFSIGSTTGVLRLLASANYEAKSSYSIDIVASDGIASSTKPVTIHVNDLNDAPVYSSGSTGSVAENAATTTVVYTAVATDPDGDTITYTLLGTDAALFSINGSTGAVTLNASANYEAKSSYSISVLAQDGVTTTPKAVTINVTNINEKPVLTAPASQSVNQGVATALTGISVADPDAGANMITMSLSVPAGTFTSMGSGGVTVLGNGTSAITLNGTQTNINAFMAASKVQYTTAVGATGTVTLSIGSNDGGNTGVGGTQTDSKTETLNIAVANAAPIVTSGTSGSVAENAATSTVVYAATASDPDGDALTYSLTGTDAALFTIDAAGAVRLISAADFEAKPSYSVVVNAKDATNAAATQSVTIQVTDVDEAPHFASGATGTVAENAATSTVIYNAVASDPESGTVSYSLAGADASAFTIHSSTGALTLNTSANYETKSSYSLTVIAADAAAHTTEQELTVNVSNLNEKPVITAPASQNILQASATVLTGISVADPDASASLITLSLSAAAGSFSATTGGGVTVTGSGTNAMTLSGAQSSLNAFMAGSGVSYTSAVGATGTVTLNIASDDGGHSGAGGTQTDSQTETLNISLGPSTTVSTVVFSADTGVSGTDLVTNTAAQTITGTLSAITVAGETVEVSLDNGVTWLVATNTIGQNNWSLGAQTLAASNTLQARVSNASGTGTALARPYVLDQAVPTTTIATKTLLADTGASSIDFITYTDEQTVSGTLNTATVTGEIVQVSLDNGATWTTATNTIGSSSWTLAGQTLIASNTLKIRVADTAGNTGTESSQAYVLDTVAPSLHAAGSTPADNAASAGIGSDITLRFTEALHSSSDTSKVYLKDIVNHTLIAATVHINGSGEMIIQPNTPLGYGVAYYVNWDAGALQDTAGNAAVGVNDTNTYNFTTASAPAPAPAPAPTPDPAPTPAPAPVPVPTPT